MPVKWSVLKVSDAMDMVEEFVDKAADPLECARIVAIEARQIPGLPQYLEERLVRLITHIERIGYVRDAIKAVRDSLPDGAVEAEKESLKFGSQLILAA